MHGTVWVLLSGVDGHLFFLPQGKLELLVLIPQVDVPQPHLTAPPLHRTGVAVARCISACCITTARCSLHLCVH